mmetsp:Transcript_39556/g.86333  ORF Transcript_39556/g.86333 Transcript_39556/m.86333 type:complete len:237 (+) Transcript_39556:308-1018(+)
MLHLDKLFVASVTTRLTSGDVAQLSRLLQLLLDYFQTPPHRSCLLLLVSAALLRLLNLPAESPRPARSSLLVACSFLLQALHGGRLCSDPLLGLGQLLPNVVGLALEGLRFASIALQAGPQLGDSLHFLTGVRYLVPVKLHVRPHLPESCTQLIHHRSLGCTLPSESSHLNVALGHCRRHLPLCLLDMLGPQCLLLIHQHRSRSLLVALGLQGHAAQLDLLRPDSPQVALGCLAVL